MDGSISAFAEPNEQDDGAADTGGRSTRRMIRSRPGSGPPRYPAVEAWIERAGPLEGAVNLVDAGRASGWARNLGEPDAPVCLEVSIGGRVVARTLADRYREDLRRAGVGTGEHGFEVAWPKHLAGTGRLEIRRWPDGAAIEGWHTETEGRAWRQPAEPLGEPGGFPPEHEPGR